MTDAGFFSTILCGDKFLFLWINLDWRNPFFDWLMPFLSNFKNFLVFFLALVGLVFWKGSAKERIVLMALALLVALCDRANSDLIKHVFHRPRPYDTIVGIHLFIKRQWMYTTPQLVAAFKNTLSFPSTHAVNVWAAAVFLGRFYRYLIPLVYTLAVMVCLSRVYVGHHYPSDVIAGGILGAGMGWGYYHLLRYAILKLDRRQRWIWKVFPLQRQE